jgi:glycosyltransferase involved in cell wall biosynthesis
MNETLASAAPPAVSVIVPVRNEAGNLSPLIAEIASALGDHLSFEVIYVNDGSSDRTEAELTQLMASRPWLRQIKHQVSCGQSAAVRTGVRHATADVVVTLDGDGQNNPAFIPALFDALAAGAPRVGLVAGQRVGRQATGFKKFQSRLANGVRSAVLRTVPATPAAASKRSAAICFSRCPISTACTGFCRHWPGGKATTLHMLTWSTARATPARRTTACGIGSGSGSLISWACGGSSAAGAGCHRSRR